ncbi:hypothetical protein GBN25_04490 [Plesiomonas shigelloides]|nr:hypothetical protein GBN25_04490 [Plesiomonas shigelloides]
MIIKFTVGDFSWESSLHQLNSDALIRHIHFYSGHGGVGISINYCESTSRGNIYSRDALVGNFAVLS